MALSFQLTRPVRGEPRHSVQLQHSRFDFNSLAPCGANHGILTFFARKGSISTHSPRAGRTLVAYDLATCLFVFQLTRPVRGEPRRSLRVITPSAISTHSPRAGRTMGAEVHELCDPNFNSLAPCGANLGLWHCLAVLPNFNSLAPCGANLSSPRLWTCAQHISTHSPRAGRTAVRRQVGRALKDFNSLAPCGANLGVS